MENDSAPVVTRRQSSRCRVPNINRQEVLTLNEAVEVRSRLAEGSPYPPLHCHALVIPQSNPATSNTEAAEVNPSARDRATRPLASHTNTDPTRISRDAAATMSVSTLFECLNLRRTDVG